MCWQKWLNFAISIVEVLICIFYQPVKGLVWIDKRLLEIQNKMEKRGGS